MFGVFKPGTYIMADLESLGSLLSSKTCFDSGPLCKFCPQGRLKGGVKEGKYYFIKMHSAAVPFKNIFENSAMR